MSSGATACLKRIVYLVWVVEREEAKKEKKKKKEKEKKKKKKKKGVVCMKQCEQLRCGVLLRGAVLT